MSKIPENLKYTKEHEWASIDGDSVRVGITDYAVGQLGDVTLVDLQSAGTTLSTQDRFGDVESVKTVSELFAPCGGDIAEVNENLEDQPELVNEDPYGKGWMVVIKSNDTSALEGLMNSTAYAKYIDELEG